MKYIPASEVYRDKIAKVIVKWCIANDEEFLPNPLADMILDALLASAVELPEPGLRDAANAVVNAWNSGRRGLREAIVALTDVTCKLDHGDELRGARGRDDRHGRCFVPEDAIANHDLIEGEDPNYGDSVEQACGIKPCDYEGAALRKEGV